MVQVIESNDIFGKIGRGFGSGLGEQIPKEMQHKRLSEGLQKLGKESPNLSPLEFLTKAYSTYGITPQMVQSLGEASRFENARNAFINRNPRVNQQKPGQNQSPSNQTQSFSQGIKEVPFGGQMSQRTSDKTQPVDERAQEHQTINQPGQLQVNQLNPTRPEAQPISLMTPEQKQDEVANILAENPTFTLDEAYAESDRREQRRMKMPEAERQKDLYNEEVRNKIKKELDEQLKTKLEKEGAEQFKDIHGENRVRVERLIEKDLRLNPNLSIPEAVNKRTNQVLDLAKSKSSLEELAGRDLFDRLSPGKNRQTLEKLKTYQKSFEETGNLEEYYNTLREKFDLTPMGAASIAYPLNTNIKEYISRLKPTKRDDYTNGHSRKYAEDILNKITPNDSILSVAYNLKQKDPNFNQEEFFKELRDHRKDLVSDFQKRELQQGESDIFPNWGDLLLFPLRG